jgi:hypothetical protein
LNSKDYVSAHSDDQQYCRPDSQAMEVKTIFISYYSKVVLHHVMMRSSFKELDIDGDGIITRDEIHQAKYFKDGKMNGS